MSFEILAGLTVVWGLAVAVLVVVLLIIDRREQRTTQREAAADVERHIAGMCAVVVRGAENEARRAAQ